VLLPLGLGTLLLLVGWHLRRVWALPRRARGAYLGSRAAVYAFLLLRAVVVAASPPGRHHYIGFRTWGALF
jgi:hypothetical protein